MHLLRLLKILGVGIRFGLDEFFLGHERVRVLRVLIRTALFWRTLDAPRAVRLRQALEALGPIFVKFGQVLSTRRDLLPPGIADELAKLQDQVPPFPAEQVTPILNRATGSRAGGGLCRLGGKRRAGRPRRRHEVVDEFAKRLEVELDLLREASNASQLGRNFRDSPLLLVPQVHWDYCSNDVMVMERMHGTPVSQIDALRAQGVDIPRLSRAGVEIFFTQVFRDGFFHADMHPGNILVTPEGRYVALHFGLIGTVTELDKNYLAQNFLAFFRRDYRRGARGQIECRAG